MNMSTNRNAKVELIFRADTLKEAKKVESDIIDIVRTLDKNAIVTTKLRRKCDGCDKTLKKGDNFVSRGGLDFCEKCQVKASA